jgi:hypothetical protein
VAPVRGLKESCTSAPSACKGAVESEAGKRGRRSGGEAKAQSTAEAAG